MTRQALAAAFCLLIGVCAGCKKKESVKPVTTNTVDGQLPSQVLRDFEMNDLRNGVKSMTLKSVEARVYEDQNVALVDNPILTFYKEGKPSSNLTAPFGRVYMQTHAVETWGGVTVVTSDSSTLTTDTLRYDPGLRKIFSEANVRIEKPDSITEGKGLETDPEFSRIKMGRQKVRFKKGMKA